MSVSVSSSSGDLNVIGTTAVRERGIAPKAVEHIRRNGRFEESVTHKNDWKQFEIKAQLCVEFKALILKRFRLGHTSNKSIINIDQYYIKGRPFPVM